MADCSITDEHGALIEGDSELITGLSSLDGANGRAITGRRHDGYPGCYIDVPSTMHAPDSDFSRVHLALITDELSTILQRVLTLMLQNDYEPSPDQSLSDEAGEEIDAAMSREVREAMVSPGKIASCNPRVDRTVPVIPGTFIPVEGFCQTRVYTEGFSLNTGLYIPEAA